MVASLVIFAAFLFLACAWAVVYAAVSYHKAKKNQSRWLSSSVSFKAWANVGFQSLRMPSLLIVPIGYVGFGALTTGIALAVHGGNTNDAILGFAAVLLFTSCLLYFMYSLTLNFCCSLGAPRPKKEDTEKAKKEATFSHRVTTFVFLSDDTHWFPLTEKSIGWKRRWIILFGDYTIEYYVAGELLVTLLMAVGGGFRLINKTYCRAMLFVAATAAVVLWIVTLRVKLGRSRFVQSLLLLFSTCAVVLFMAALVMDFLPQSDSFDRFWTVAVTLYEGVLALKLLTDFGSVFYWVTRGKNKSTEILDDTDSVCSDRPFKPLLQEQVLLHAPMLLEADNQEEREKAIIAAEDDPKAKEEEEFFRKYTRGRWIPKKATPKPCPVFPKDEDPLYPPQNLQQPGKEEEEMKNLIEEILNGPTLYVRLNEQNNTRTRRDQQQKASVPVKQHHLTPIIKTKEEHLHRVQSVLEEDKRKKERLEELKRSCEQQRLDEEQEKAGNQASPDHPEGETRPETAAVLPPKSNSQGDSCEPEKTSAGKENETIDTNNRLHQQIEILTTTNELELAAVERLMKERAQRRLFAKNIATTETESPE